MAITQRPSPRPAPSPNAAAASPTEPTTQSPVKSPVKRTVNGSSVLLIIVGSVFAAASLRGLQWYSIDAKKGLNVAGSGFTYADLGSNADRLTAPVASAYFHWLGWALLIAMAVLGLAANIPSPISDPLRVAGFLVSLLGIVATYYALAQLFNAQEAAGGSAHSVWHNASYGTWAALVGFALGALGAGLGPRRL